MNPSCRKLLRRHSRVRQVMLSAAVASTCSSAFAQSAVSVSGAVDAGIAYVKTDSASQMQLATGSIAASSLVFQGTENLGRGYNAFFLLRTLFFTDTGEVSANRLYGSESKVGLSGPQGRIEAGRLFNPTHQALVFKSPSQSNFAGAFNMAIGGYQPYWNDSLRYTTPNFHGATLAVQHSFGDTGVSGNNNAAGTAYAINYDLGKLSLSGIYETVSTVALPAVNYRAKRSTVMGVYDFGFMKAHAGFFNENHGGVGAPLEFNLAILGVSKVVTGALRVTAEYGHKDFKNSSNQANYVGLAAFYSLSKRTTLYSQINLIHNGGAAQQGVYRGIVPRPGENTSGYLVGMRHTF
ncbi:porin [Pigmentiphaga litoralis]|uniref:porin n=1 Tax=Pigmentiphaga litoralis TaxID=516702 RepID=UPI001679540B|nr:porin [Pigmentiphaga litoralis]